MANSKAIFLNKGDDSTYAREWGGLQFKAKLLPDGSLQIKCHEQPVQVCPVQSNDFGNYYVVSLYGGKGFASLGEGEYGPYLRLKLNEEVRLPGNPNKPKSGANKKPYNNKKQYSDKKSFKKYGAPKTAQVGNGPSKDNDPEGLPW